MKQTLSIRPFIVVAFFLVFLGMGLCLIRDYGISWDEHEQRQIGILNVDYIVKGDQALLSFEDRIYGPSFEILLVAIERSLHIQDVQTVVLMRHGMTFLMFFIGVLFFYKLVTRITQSWLMGLMGALFLILSPRIFADAFYNSKDIPCLAFFIICTYSLIRYLENKTIGRACLHAILCAVLIDIRIVGIIIPFLTLVFTLMDIVIMREGNFKKIFLSLSLYVAGVVGLMVLFWPFLWTAPIAHFRTAFINMSYHSIDGTVLYLGEHIKVSHLPWHYVFVWIGITTPLIYLLGFGYGFLKVSMAAGKNPVSFYKEHKNQLVILFLFILPIISVIVLKSRLYDAWRQMFFIYPFFLIFILIGLKAAFDGIQERLGEWPTRALFILLVGGNLLFAVVFMFRNHPYQNVYFNSLAGRNFKDIKNKFEMDYWGLSYTQVLKYIVSHDNESIIKICVAGRPEGVDTALLEAHDRERLHFVDELKDAKYFVGNYRWHKEDYPFEREFYSVRIDGTALATAYRL